MRLCIEVWGDYACFTRPEFKVERMSYDIITPSAAREIFSAILWRPAIHWQIHKISVLNPIKWISIMRNEVSTVAKIRTMTSINATEVRQQRTTLLLKDVAYRIHADFVLTKRASATDNIAKFSEMFRRRVGKGQCFAQPYFGCREFSCGFRLVEEAKNERPAIQMNQPLGWMLYGMNYGTGETPVPQFFNATLENGVVFVPPPGSPDIKS
jgi:CRISPR-associated protein Cas5d